MSGEVLVLRWQLVLKTSRTLSIPLHPRPLDTLRPIQGCSNRQTQRPSTAAALPELEEEAWRYMAGVEAVGTFVESVLGGDGACLRDAATWT